jgi:hypothetical protein
LSTDLHTYSSYITTYQTAVIAASQDSITATLIAAFSAAFWTTD